MDPITIAHAADVATRALFAATDAAVRGVAGILGETGMGTAPAEFVAAIGLAWCVFALGIAVGTKGMSK